MSENDPNQQMDQQSDEISLTEIIAIIWHYKLLIIILPIALALVAFGVSQFLTPSYSSTAKVYLGNFGNEMYTSADSAEEVIMSNDLLEDVIENLELSHDLPRDLRGSVSIESLSESSMLEITATHEKPERAQDIASGVITQYLDRAEPAYEDRQAIVEQLYESTFENYEQTSASLARNKEALTDIEENEELSETERDLSRSRLIDYVEMDETQLNELDQQLQDQQLELKDLHGPEVFEQATMPRSPDSPNPMLNTAIAFVIGAMVSVGLAFVLEFFKNNPIRRKHS
ncbi:capsular polysaccharide biosynthesis protein [Salibacterium salarium]|uniref:YveK family protein n=1 Tax=Salibacterium salarium TaxID=284579 RepID=UPI00278A3191|nr:Wzz/FepE/Etk N-terminal domain-containing protein [Salibacterium salarium]MDQ0297877.1 capsular polysaccharide biosynthesis protein [Salibacterium salarium]